MKCVPDILWSPSYKSDSSVAVDQVLGGVVSVSDEILEPANKPMVGIILSHWLRSMLRLGIALS